MSKDSDYDWIIYFDANGKEVGREPAATAKRFSMEVRMNERKMAAFKKAHPEVVHAQCRGGRFSFTADGQSWHEK
jgi:hypothetical protein